ncbi:MAG: cation:proton antiporter [Methanomassiliicoccales archaeon]|nr:MAG: cation:proton antiporter [Methanomassiliicoccales archaeon]
METSNLIFEIGAIMIVSFIGAALAMKAKQSVIIGYILAGMLIGPHMALELFGWRYDGLVHDTDLISALSMFGLTLLMFFVGLEFSFSKLRRTRSPALIVALLNTGLDMFMGVTIGYILGWPIIDTVFLAGVFAMGSAAITGKSLLEMQKMSAPETEFLLGILVVEDFVSMVLMTIAGGLIFKSNAVDPFSLTQMIVGIVAFYAFFIFLALLVIPRTIKQIERIKNDELFVLFALGMLLLSAALAEAAGVPAIIGAFFLGMVFAESRLSKRLEERISPFKDAFVAVFFVSFGMMIDPAMFGTVLPIVVLAIPLVILSDLLLTGALAYFLGFGPKGAAFMGSSMCGRGAESVMFATIGSNSVGVTKASVIHPFAGAFCFSMSMMTPALMRASGSIADFFRKILPSSVRLSAALINRTVGKVILPSSLKLFQRTRRMDALLVSYFILLILLMITNGPPQLMVLTAVLTVTAWMYPLAEKEFLGIVRTCNYDNLGVAVRDPRQISRFISAFITAAMAAIVLATFMFTIIWWSSLLVLLGYLVSLIVMMHTTSRAVRAHGEGHALNVKSIQRAPSPLKTKNIKDKAQRRAAFGSIVKKQRKVDVTGPYDRASLSAEVSLNNVDGPDHMKIEGQGTEDDMRKE